MNEPQAIGVHAHILSEETIGLIAKAAPAVAHSKSALEFLVGSVGSAHVLLGSDYPFDMGMLDCARHVRSLALSAADRATILSGRARELLGGSPDASRTTRRA
jgi:aminocarboxymuconate-semialdehyde decarboxylase